MAILNPQAIAIIPARGGSKRIPQKNIKDFLGKPLIAHSISKAKESQIFSRVIVSTDCPKIAEISQYYGAEVPFVRDQNLSDDFTPTLDVIIDAIKQCEIKDSTPICCIYPTAVLLQITNLQRAKELLETQTPSYVFLATHFSFTPFRGFSYKNQTLTLLHPEFQNSRSQDLSQLYHDAGQFYFGLSQTFKNKIPIFSPDSIPIFVPNLEVQDIDTLEDLELAKLKYKLAHDKN